MEDFKGHMMQYAMADDGAQINSTWTPELVGVVHRAMSWLDSIPLSLFDQDRRSSGFRC